MMAIHKKALKHASDTLKTIDTFPIYMAVSNALKEANVPEQETKSVLKSLQEESYKIKKISEEATDWIDAIIEETNP